MKENNPLISIIVPVYKVEQYLDRCIFSIVNQTYQNLEIILVDDGSPDKCPQICEEWSKKDNRIKLIHKENGGLSSARNAAIDISEGEYITFIDSDDWISKDYVEYLLTLIKKTGADLSVGNYVKTSYYMDNLFETNNIKEKIITGRDFLLKILKVNTQENVQYAWGKLYKNFRNTEIRYPEGLIDEDVPTTFKYATICNTVAISTKLVYAYFENKDSILRKKFNRNRFDLLEVWKMIIEFAAINCNEEILRYSRVNYYRANFGILCNISIEECNYDDLEYIHMKEKEALNIVRIHKDELLKFPMPISRKFFVLGFSIYYPLFKKILKLARKIYDT